MARRPNKRSTVHQILPFRSVEQIETTNLVAASVIWGRGITDLPSYFRELRVSILLGLFVGACLGLSSYGLKGLIVGGLLGMAAPAVLLWLGVVLVAIFIPLLVYVALWSAILYGIGWFLFG